MVNTVNTLLVRVRRLAAAARRSEDLATADREARDQAIEAADLAGHSVREIAREAGLSVGRVQGVIVERTAIRQADLVRAARLHGPPQGPLGTPGSATGTK